MIARARTLISTRLRRALRTFALVGTTVAALFLLLSHATDAVAEEIAKAAAPCGFSDAVFDPASDVHAWYKYGVAIAQLLKQEKFGELDCLADAARAGKSRFSGGAWKLRYIYLGLDSPRPGHPTQEDWRQHFGLMDRWIKQNPHSITARIALAESYVQYGWDARGNGYSDNVSESGWKLLSERAARAKAILDAASETARKCPDWYFAMQEVAQAQGWNVAPARALYERAVAFEPDYQYYYRTFAEYLQPKWSGKEGDAARFAEEAANNVGGDAGDTLYFLIADVIVCACQDDREFSHFSWPRAQKGFAALEKKYGPSMVMVNSYALMATKSQDWVDADSAFKRIGNEWNEDKWVSEGFFQGQRTIAAQFAPFQLKARAFRAEAEANMKTAEGKAYRMAFDPKLAAFEQPCTNEINSDPSKFEFFVEVGEHGEANDAHTERQPNAFAMCMMKGIYAAHLKKETPFPAPPKVPYRLIVEIDPAVLTAAAK